MIDSTISYYNHNVRFFTDLTDYELNKVLGLSQGLRLFRNNNFFVHLERADEKWLNVIVQKCD